MKSLLAFCFVALLGITFSVSVGYAQCPYTDYAPYIVIYKYATGKTKVLEKWECVRAYYYSTSSVGSGFCFDNQAGAGSLTQRICISGDFKIVEPPAYR
jgi:hypothetical protein